MTISTFQRRLATFVDNLTTPTGATKRLPICPVSAGTSLNIASASITAAAQHGLTHNPSTRSARLSLTNILFHQRYCLNIGDYPVLTLTTSGNTCDVRCSEWPPQCHQPPMAISCILQNPLRPCLQERALSLQIRH